MGSSLRLLTSLTSSNTGSQLPDLEKCSKNGKIVTYKEMQRHEKTSFPHKCLKKGPLKSLFLCTQFSKLLRHKTGQKEKNEEIVVTRYIYFFIFTFCQIHIRDFVLVSLSIFLILSGDTLHKHQQYGVNCPVTLSEKYHTPSV